MADLSPQCTVNQQTVFTYRMILFIILNLLQVCKKVLPYVLDKQNISKEYKHTVKFMFVKVEKHRTESRSKSNALLIIIP